MLYDLGPEDVDGYATRIAAVDAAAVASDDRRVPSRNPADLAIVLIGDATQIRDVAAKYGR